MITDLAEINAVNYGLFKQAYKASMDVSKFLDQYEIAKLLGGPYDVQGASVIIKAGNDSIHSAVLTFVFLILTDIQLR